MRTLAHENLALEIRRALVGPTGNAKFWALWHPDDVGPARRMPQRQWFRVYQPLLLRMARTQEGRAILGVPDGWPAPYLIEPSAMHAHIGNGQRIHRFWPGQRVGNRIRYQWPAFKVAAKAIYERWESGRLVGREPVLDWGGLLVRAAATDTFYPDPDIETATVDGLTGRISVIESFATKRAGAGNSSLDNSTNNSCPYNVKTGGSDDYAHMRRGVTLFDTSSLSGATVDSANWAQWMVSALTFFTDPQYLHLCSTAPASNTALANSDFDIANWGSVSFGISLEYGSITTGAYEVIALNASGLAAIDTEGITKIGQRGSDDFTNTAGTGLGGSQQLGVHYADQTGTANDPYLEVTSSTAKPRTAVVI